MLCPLIPRFGKDHSQRHAKARIGWLLLCCIGESFVISENVSKRFCRVRILGRIVVSLWRDVAHGTCRIWEIESGRWKTGAAGRARKHYLTAGERRSDLKTRSCLFCTPDWLGQLFTCVYNTYIRHPSAGLLNPQSHSIVAALVQKSRNGIGQKGQGVSQGSLSFGLLGAMVKTDMVTDIRLGGHRSRTGQGRIRRRNGGSWEVLHGC